jgi:hypothetical protein
MRVYRVAWLVVAALLAVVGNGMALVLSPVVLVYLVGVAVIGTIVMLIVVREDEGRPDGDRRGRLLTPGLVAGTGLGAFVGFASLLGAGVMPLALAVLASSPYVVEAWSRWQRSLLTPSTGQLVAMDDAFASTSPGFGPAQALIELSLLTDELSLLTDEQLCQAWRTSYRALEGGPSGIRMGAVAERQRVLDEFERRNSRGLAAWLASGARAAGNPLPYLAEGRVNGQAIDWDELTRGLDC